MDLGDLARTAEVVLQGRVIRHWSAWDESHRFVWTHYLVQVEDRLKGRAAATTIVSEPGGAMNGMAMKVEGVPEYRDGEEIVVFLHRTPVGYWRCYGLKQGKFTVTEDPAGRKRVYADLTGFERLDTPRNAAAKRRAAGAALESLNGTTLAQFKQRILRELSQR